MKLNKAFDKQTIRLIKMIEKDNERIAHEMIESGVDINVLGQSGVSPLIYFLFEKNSGAMMLALSLGADPNFPDADGDTPVTLASGAEDDRYLELLLKSGGDVNAIDSNGHPAIFASIGEGRITQVKMFVKNGVNLNLVDRSNQTTGKYASNLNKYEIVYLLIESGLDFNIRSDTGADIAWRLHDSLDKNLMDPSFQSYQWALKVKQQLLDNGVVFPPSSPLEVRINNGIADKYDIDAYSKLKQENDLKSK